MASGSYNLNTWAAKRIIGDNSTTVSTDALLQITDNNSWILTNNRVSTYGILYVYDNSTAHDKIEIYGGYQVSSTDTPTAWVQLDTGDVYILGKVGIGYDPNTSGNTYKLYVNGTSNYTGTMRLENGSANWSTPSAFEIMCATKLFQIVPSQSGESIDIGFNWLNYDGAGISFRTSSNSSNPGQFVIFARRDSSHSYTLTGNSGGDLTWTGNWTVNGKSTLTGNVGIGASYSNDYKLYVNGTMLIEGVITYKDKIINASYANNNVSSTQYPTTFNITDSANRIITRSEAIVQNNGDIAAYWYVRNYDTSGVQVGQKGIRMTMDKSGNLTYTISDPAKFITAIMGDSTSAYFYRGDKTWSNALTGGASFGGNVSITASGPSFWVKDSTKNVMVYLHAATNGETGLYSEGYWDGSAKVSNAKWMVYRATNGSIQLNGNAATATRINGNLAAATSDVNRNIWVSSTASADGIPNYISGFNMNPSTKVFTVPADTRISPSAGALYLGNSGNQSWVYVQDMCSQSGNDKWKITQAGAALFVSTVTCGGVETKGDINLYTSSADSPDITWWYANKGKEQARIWMGSGFSSKAAPNFREYKSDGTSLYSGVLPLGDGTGASGTWGINITGRAYSLKDRTNDNTSYLNYGAAGLAASAITWLCCWNGYEVRAISKAEMANATDSAHKWVRLAGDTMTGALTCSSGIVCNHGVNFMVGGNEVNFIPDSYNSTFWFNYETYNRKNNGKISQYLMGDGHHNWNTTHVYAGAVHNAVWNDFAEFRESDITEPGRTLISNGKGQMILCQERLAPGAKIISDTYGCSVGESDLAKTPLGVAGRVLAYPYQDRNNYKPGDAVCAAPNGTIDIMTREEIKEYPDRIIGIVDEIPNYSRWKQYHTCYKDSTNSSTTKVADIKINGRIWIYVR